MSYGIRDSALLRLVTSFGDVDYADLIIDRLTGRSKGFAFVRFKEETAARGAVAALNGSRVTSVGELAPSLEDRDYHSWLLRSWRIPPSGLREYSDERENAARVIAIVEESSRRLAQCVAEYPAALEQIEWRDFERMLAIVFEGLGFKVICGRGSKDGGVDLRLTTPSASFVVQAKHWVSGKKVGAATLNATISVAVAEGHTGAIVLSTSGFARNAITAITSVERQRLRIGDRLQIHSLCRTYVGVAHGLLHQVDSDYIVRAHTRPASDSSAGASWVIRPPTA